MKKQHKIIWKLYFVIFTMISCTNISWLLKPNADPFILYHILMAWTNFYTTHYFLAIFKCLIALICLITLYGFAFNLQTRHASFWKWMLIIRLLSDFTGNFYEFIFIKSTFQMVLGYGLTTLGVFILPSIPSYIAHYLYAFSSDQQKS